MPRGRPVRSQIRQNIIEILYFLGSSSGYDLYKIYVAIYPKVTMRSIYYHMKKGLSLGEFKIDRIEKVHGNYSWGPESEKTFYALGDNAKPKMDSRVKEYLDSAEEEKHAKIDKKAGKKTAFMDIPGKNIQEPEK
ncbi:MAG: hypothetical protein NT001_02665 [Candidatus Woesearchaeota archaeon]|nr:hypothetical protein [Candidatus Woesearchaeota archaeon]